MSNGVRGAIFTAVIVASAAAGLSGAGAAFLRAQERNPMSQQAPPDDNKITKESEGVYLYRVKVVQRDLDAVNYLHRSGSTRIAFNGTPLLPMAKGEAKVTSERGGITIHSQAMIGLHEDWDVDFTPFRELWMKNGLQTFHPLQTLASYARR